MANGKMIIYMVKEHLHPIQEILYTKVYGKMSTMDKEQFNIHQILWDKNKLIYMKVPGKS